MKAMKGLSMNKVLGGIKRKPTVRGSENGSNPNTPIDASAKPGEPPEETAARCVRAFCESGGQNANGDEVTYLPSIVDAAESSPAAAAECARLIRKFLYMEHWSKPSLQYNAIMLLRILADNPGPTFTRCINQKFVDSVKALLRSGRDPSVRMMLMETLDAFEATNSSDEGLSPVVTMWAREKEKAYKAYGGRPPAIPSPPDALSYNAQLPTDRHSQNYLSRSLHHRRLPDPIELANRLEEARTSAKLLEQVVACTPPAEVLSNELIMEFADRCQSASRSIQSYLSATDPTPDNETMESLIDTNEQLQQALNQHQRAMLYARKQLGERNGGNQGGQGLGTDTTPDGTNTGGSSRSDRPLPSIPATEVPPPASGKGKGPAQGWPAPSSFSAGPSQNRLSAVNDGYDDHDNEDPFKDPEPERPSHNHGGVSGSGSREGPSAQPPRLAVDSFHPGFHPTPSYLDRQDSAMNKVQMHGAVLPDNSGDGTGDSTAPRGPPPGRYDELEAELGDDEDMDRYNATPRKEGQVFRY